MSKLGFLLACALLSLRGFAATYYVDQASADASDENPGTEAAPWKTIGRAAAASELQPGDTVLVKSGVYREHVNIRVSGEPDKPITFAAAPDARVVIKGSEIVKGTWSKLKAEPGVQEPYPGAFERVWKTQLGDEYFTDAVFAASYEDKSKRWVSQVFVQDWRALQRIGPDPVYPNDPYLLLATVGHDLKDMVEDTFWFDPNDQTLYVKMAGHPEWYTVEVGVRGYVLTAVGVHDVVIRGFEMRHNRQPTHQENMVAIVGCERILIEGCRIYQADFCGLGLRRCKNCIVRGCDLSYNGNTGFRFEECEDCIIEDCKLLFNNYRRFFFGWHCGGMKCIPFNRRCTVQRCEAAYNIASDGIWFDTLNSDIRILDNVSHHNDGCGIFFEINKDGGIIANNLVYANRGRGIYISGSQNTWVVHNTVAYNDGGIICMPREGDWTLENVFVYNNLLINNYVTAQTITRGSDLTLYMGELGYDPQPGLRTAMTVHSDYNVFANNSWTPLIRHHWNPDNTLQQWQERFGEDLHSRLVPVAHELDGTSFRLLSTEGLDVAGPLPAQLGWKPAYPRRVGCDRTHWP